MTAIVMGYMRSGLLDRQYPRFLERLLEWLRGLGFGS